MPKLNLATVTYLLIATFLWAGNAVVGSMLANSISAVSLSTARWGLAVLVLIPLGWRVFRFGSPLWENKKRFLLLGLFGIGMYHGLLYFSLQTSTAINVTLIGSSMPIWMLLIGAFYYQIKPSLLQFIGSGISLLGVAVVLTRGDLSTLMTLQIVAGDFLVMIATVLWAFYNWMLSRPGSSTEREWPWSNFLLAQAFSGFLWTALFDGVEIAAGYAYFDFNVKTAFLILFLALGPSVVAYRCWGLGLRGAGPNAASLFYNFTPFFTALLSVALLRESFQLFHGTAFALIVAGILVSSKTTSPKGNTT
jgi:drug/metabolite transporter (DMT)-like permease